MIIRTFAVTLAVLTATQPTAASWANVRNIPPNTRISVRMLDNVSQSGYSVTKGRFESADDDTLMLRTKRQTLMLPKSTVEEIRVRIPFNKRKMPWIITSATGIATLIVLPYGGFRTPGSSWGDDIPHIFALFGLGVTSAVAALTFGRGNMKAIYPTIRFDIRKIQPEGKLTSPPARKGRIP